MKIKILLIFLLILTVITMRAQTPLSPSGSFYKSDSSRFEAKDMVFKKPLEFSTFNTGRFLSVIPAIVKPGFEFHASDCRFEELVFSLMEDSRIDLEYIQCKNGVHVRSGMNLQVAVFDSRIRQELYTANCRIKKLELYRDTIDNLDLEQSDFKKVFISNCFIQESAVLSGVIRETLSLYNNRFAKGVTLDLSALKGDSLGKKIIPIELTTQLIDQVNLNYKNFHLVFDSSIPKDSCLQIYRRLIQSFKRKNQDTSVKKLEREMRYFKGNDTFWEKASNFAIDEYEDYGQDLNFMYKFTLGVLLLYTFCNILVGYRKLNSEVYEIPNFEPELPRNKYYRIGWHIYYSLVYTSVLFINPLVKLENLKYKKPLLLAWVLFIYFSGLVLLYYIVHYLLKL